MYTPVFIHTLGVGHGELFLFECPWGFEVAEYADWIGIADPSSSIHFPS